MYEQYFEGYDPSYTYSFSASWSTYEEHGWIFIFEKNNEFYSIEGGHCVMVADEGTPTWANDLQGPFSIDAALAIMEEWKGDEDEDLY